VEKPKEKGKKNPRLGLDWFFWVEEDGPNGQGKESLVSQESGSDPQVPQPQNDRPVKDAKGKNWKFFGKARRKFHKTS